MLAALSKHGRAALSKHGRAASHLFTQLILHEVHHRAQVMNILRELGAGVGDLDFIAMMFERRAVGA
jgi:uncharacterized damage-inducible protein DinB